MNVLAFNLRDCLVLAIKRVQLRQVAIKTFIDRVNASLYLRFSVVSVAVVHRTESTAVDRN